RRSRREGRGEGGAPLRTAPAHHRGGRLSPPDRPDPRDRTDALGRRRLSQPAQRGTCGRLGCGLDDRLARLRPAAPRSRTRPRARGMDRRLRPCRHCRGGPARPAPPRSRAHRGLARVILVHIARAIGQLGDPRFQKVLAKGVGLTVAGLVVLGWLLVTLVGWMMPETVMLPWIGEVGFLDDVAGWAAVATMLVLSIFLMV